MGGWVGGWFKSVVILRLSQPSLAGVGAWAELGKKSKLSQLSTTLDKLVDCIAVEEAGNAEASDQLSE